MRDLLRKQKRPSGSTGGKGKNNVMTQQLMDGATLQGGKYRIERALGQGGFGITYLAVQTGLDRTVAIKEFFMKEWCERDTSTSHVTMGTEAGRATVGRFREKFMKEARNIARLEHPNIVRIHDIFEENGTCYYVMDYAGGGSLDDLVKRKGCLPELEATRYILQVAGALAYVHAQNMTHLDVKPSNILLNDRGEAILIDFGLSKQYDAVSGGQTSTTPVGISEGYAPMEQYRQGGVSEFSPETDIYALGATFFKLLTGKTPPSASDIFEEGVPVQELRSRGVSQAAISVITQAMEPKRKERMKDVRLFINGLNGTVPSPRPAARPVSVPVAESAGDDEATKVMSASYGDDYASRDDDEPAGVNPPAQHSEESQYAATYSRPAAQTNDNAQVTRSAMPEKGKSNEVTFLVIIGIVAVVVLVAVMCNSLGGHSDRNGYAVSCDSGSIACDTLSYVDTCSLVLGGASTEVSNATFNLADGRSFVYSGPVDSDGLPDGYGTAKYSGNSSIPSGTFTGTWVHGMRYKGETRYSDGRVSNGVYDKNGYFAKGTCWNEDGSYFEGTLSDGEFYNGQCYDPQGYVYGGYVNGNYYTIGDTVDVLP